MKLSGVHLLLTYACNFECDHCFVWGSPSHSGAMTLSRVREILRQASDLGTVEWIYFEGGEPFLHYAIMLRGAQEAASLGFRVGIVSNAYWATEIEDALEWLRPLRGIVQDLSISSDAYHGDETRGVEITHACAAASELGIPVATISIAQPETTSAARAVGQLPAGESAVVYRGRAAQVLASRAELRPWAELTSCPCEDFLEPGRIHIDPYGDVHVCQGIRVGNVGRTHLREICAAYDPDAHPIIGPLLRGGPARLAHDHGVSHADGYADACHMCDDVRRGLRPRYPEILGPDEMYGARCDGTSMSFAGSSGTSSRSGS
jgi:MoaA/NifB/PqqE/SkfB family radical SAM enzyme